MAYHEITSYPPLYITFTNSENNSDDYLVELAASTKFLSTCKSCVWLRFFGKNEVLPIPSKENIIARREWIDNNIDIVKNNVRCIVNVVNSSFYEQASKINIEKVYGVKGTCCRSLNEALKWININAPHADLANVNIDKLVLSVNDLFKK